MELHELLENRRMVRSFDATPVDVDWLVDRCAEALWAPSAGNTAGVRMHVVGRPLVPAFFDAATDEEWRASARRAPGLARAGAVVLVTSRPGDYTARYGEADKAGSGLENTSGWTVPYWHTDAAMATMALLLLLEEANWQATIWGNFRHDERILHWAQVSDEALFCSVLVGRGDGNDVASASLERELPKRSERVSRVR
ncbi:MAG TPA: nitroreductase family protein [Acidimicrobiales bacterium]